MDYAKKRTPIALLEGTCRFAGRICAGFGRNCRGDDMKGENAYEFPFHYGQEAESYTFYRVPKILFTAEAFDHLSTDTKLLYGILLDRMQLSIKNNWIDEDGKVFIYYGWRVSSLMIRMFQIVWRSSSIRSISKRKGSPY